MVLESETDAMQRGYLPLACLACLLLMSTACTVGPQYQRPEVQVPTDYKESPPASFKAADGWKAAQPSDDADQPGNEKRPGQCRDERCHDATSLHSA